MAVAVECSQPSGGKTRRAALSRRDEQSEMTVGPPIDFSFKYLNSLDDLPQNESCRAKRVGRMPTQLQSKRFLSASLWLNNNHLTSIWGLSNLMHKLIEQPEALGWLDLSYNQLTDISDEILQFPNLQILYLHSNQLTKLSSVAKLRHLENLRNFTVRGNPLDNIPSYRSYIISIIPQIIRLDHVPITAGERANAPPAGFAKKKAMLLK